MKRTILALGLIILLCAAACSQRAPSGAGQSGVPVQAAPAGEALPEPADEPDAAPEATPAPAGERLSLANDIGIAVDGTWYPIYQDASGLLAALGEDYDYSEAPSCVFEGMDKEFIFDGCSVYTNPDGDKDIWYDMLLENDTLATSRGIRVGDSLADVQTAYGDAYYWEGDTILTYSVSGDPEDIASPCILFYFEGENEIVTTIQIYYPTNVT